MNFTQAAFLAAFVFFIGQNVAFGWNAEPQSEAEKRADYFTAGLFIFAFGIWVVSGHAASKPTTTIIIHVQPSDQDDDATPSDTKSA